MDDTAHTFSAYADGTLIEGSTDTVYNLNEFKRVQGFGALVYYQNGLDSDGQPINEGLEGAQVAERI